LSVVLGVLLCLVVGRSYSQARGPQTPAEQQRWLQEQQQKFQQQRLENGEKRKGAQQDARRIYDEYSDEAWQEILGTTPEQWQKIKPRLEKVKQAPSVPVLRPSIYAFGGEGSNSSSSSSFSSGTPGTSAGAGGAGGFGTGGGGVSGGAGGGGSSSVPQSAGGGHYVVSGRSGGGMRSAYSGSTSGNAQVGGGAGGSYAAGGAGGTGTSSGGGYGYSIGGPAGPVKKKVGDVSLGWQWQRSSGKKSPDQLSENEKTCEQLLDAVDARNPDPAQVRQCVEALRKVREQVQTQRREARQQLREVVTPEQETKLILMGYLD
jgi:hypothetical protein